MLRIEDILDTEIKSFPSIFFFRNLREMISEFNKIRAQHLICGPNALLCLSWSKLISSYFNFRTLVCVSETNSPDQLNMESPVFSALRPDVLISGVDA